MTGAAPKVRFPFGLTLATAVACAILVALGVWQVKRLAWKEALLAHIEALKTAPAVPIGPVLARLKAGQDVEWTRVEATCAPAPASPNPLRYALNEGKIVWRAESVCRLAADPSFPAVLVDRGFVESTVGQTSAESIGLPAPVRMVGVLRDLKLSAAETGKIAQAALPRESGGALPRLVLVAEHEDPAPPGIAPSALPGHISNNHLSYALTWFGLAGALLAVYAAMLRRRLRGAA